MRTPDLRRLHGHSLGLARLELRRFYRGRLPRAALVALLLLPLLYGALYLWSFWNPYGHLDRLPVALVNEDRPVTVQGRRIDAGRQLSDNLIQRRIFGWDTVSPAEAAKGVASGKYYLSLTIPASFSQDIASSDSDHPADGQLQVETNDSNNYIVGQISRSVFDEIRAATSTQASHGFYDQVFVGFSGIHDRTVTAADGADKLTSGTQQAERSAGQLADGTNNARSGAQQLATGLDQAAQGSAELAKGLGTLDHGAGQLASGAQQAASGTQQLADAVDPVAANLSPLLHEHPQLISASATLVATSAQQIADNLGKLPAATDQALADARDAAQQLDSLYAKQCGTGTGTGTGAGTGTGSDLDTLDCTRLRQADQAAQRVVAVAVRLDTTVHQLTPELDSLARDAQRVAALAKPLEQPGLATKFDAAVARIDQLNSGVHRLATSSAALQQGAGQAMTSADTLAGGLTTLDGGARTLAGGLYRLSDGAQQLDTGLGTLAGGSGRLAGGLHDGAGQIPDFTAAQRDARAGAMSDPVQLARNKLNPTPDYGTGFAPYFIPLALWVGAMVGYMLLRPLSNRALSANTPAWRAAFAGWLPVAGIGLLQAAALMAVLCWGLGLHLVHAAGVCGFLALTVLCFSSVTQWLNARFGPAGRLLALALLMLQLTSAGGTYPVETSPGFFGAIHPYLPMSYVVAGLRRLVSGGDLTAVWTGSAVLLAFTVGALALTTLTAHRRQLWTVGRLHPELTL
ncbi:putative membrane protein [Streptacidiphilus sp. MAP12-16]|uniref:YhgE/Pip family protein n=1 Tax=Streptacidiphilus sp. MAP12-16 TaxID=3156300 RepID=UPI003513B319